MESLSQVVNGTKRLSERAETLIGECVAGAAPARRARLTRLLRSAAIGDAVGCTVEFMSAQQAEETVRRYRSKGYPLEPIGGGPFQWSPGDITDDTEMAIAVARACCQSAPPALSDFANEYSVWLATGPRDVGNTIRRVVTAIRAGATASEAAWSDYQRNPMNSANGALMRNAPVCAVADSIDEAFRLSVLQGIVTHYHPTSVLCCAIQTYLIFNGFTPDVAAREVNDIAALATDYFLDWLRSRCDDLAVNQWRERVSETAIDGAQSEVIAMPRLSSLRDMQSAKWHAVQGWSILSLSMALRVAQHAAGTRPINMEQIEDPIAPGRGFNALAVFALVGADADTYGAIAGPIIESAAIHNL